MQAVDTSPILPTSSHFSSQPVRVKGLWFIQAWFTLLGTQMPFHVLAFFLFSPFLLVDKMLSYLPSACAHLGALLLFILPVMLWPKIFALVPSAQSGFHGYFLAHHSGVFVFTTLITQWNYLVHFFHLFIAWLPFLPNVDSRTARTHLLLHPQLLALVKAINTC